MTAHISYNAKNLKEFTHSASPSDSMHTVLEDFDNSAVRGEHLKDLNFGQFYGGGFTSGTRYSFESQEVPKHDPGHYYAFEADGDLHYNFSQHTLYGELDSVELGAHIDKSTGTVTDPALKITFDQPLTASAASDHSNPVHQVVWGLMNGSVDGAQNNGQPLDNSGLVAALSHEGIDLNASLESMGHAAGTTGIAAQTESDYSLAA